EARQPLGEGDTQPAVRKLELNEGDLLLGASVALDEAISVQDLTAILARTTEDALPDLYLRTKELPAFGLFAITCYQEAEPDGLPEERAGVASGVAVGAATQ